MSGASSVVHVVDDDAAVRDSIRWLIEGEGIAVRTHASAEDFLAGLHDAPPGCAVVDVRMPGMSGLELQEVLGRRRVRMPLVFVTAHGDVSLAVLAMRRGAVDFVEKPFPDEQLVEAVRRALAVQSGQPVESEDPALVRTRAASLSQRERDVLAAVVEGQSSKAIGTRLGIATKTVEAHRARIMAKLGAPSLAALVRMAVQYALLEPPAR